MAFLLYGTKVAKPDLRAKLNVNAVLLRWDISDEDYLSTNDYTESRLKERKYETGYQKNTLFYSRK